MPWNESKRMDEGIKFAVRLLDGEKMAADCRGDDGNNGLTSLNANMFSSSTGACPYVVD